MTTQPIRDLIKLATMEQILSSKPRNFILFKLGINLALRISDLLRLKVSDVQGEYLDLVQHKNKKPTHILFNGKSRRYIAEYLEKVPLGNDDYLFAKRPGGKPLSRQQAYNILRNAARQARILTRIGTHSLRKTWGYHARQTFKVPDNLIMKKLGHKNFEDTLRYIGIEQDEVNRVEQLVEL